VGEIRSTLDIIMERTRGMTLSSEERHRLRREELRKMAKGFRLKLLGNPTDAEQILSALDSESPEEREVLEFLLWQEMVQDLPADKEILNHLDAMRHLPQAAKKSHLLAELRTEFKAGQKGAAEDRKKTVAREKKKLAALGISGSAVIPKISKESEAGSDAVSLVATYQKQLLDEPLA
jgi:hypothetical protein